MSVLEFISDVIDSLLSWPVLLVVVLLVFREPFKSLLERITRWRGFGQELEFGEKSDKAAEAAQEAIETVEAPPGPPPATTETPPLLEAEDDLALHAESDPSYVVLAAWTRLEWSIRDLARAVLDGRHLKTIGSVLSEMRRREIVSKQVVDALRELRDLRNDVAHGRHRPTPGEALSFLEATRTSIQALEILISIEQAQHSADDDLADDVPDTADEPAREGDHGSEHGDQLGIAGTLR